MFMATITAHPFRDGGMRDVLNALKTDTASNAVIAANWSLGSIMNELGRRTTIVDEEQNLPKIRTMCKAVFCTEDEDEALQFLKEHKATHIVLNPMDILQLNLHFFAVTGLDENLGRSYPVTPLKLSDKSDRKLEYIVNYPISIKINTKYNLETVKKVIIPFLWGNEGFTISSPPSIVIHEGNSEKTVSVKELIIADRQWYFPEAEIDGCVWKRSGIIKDALLESSDPMALYFSPEARESLAVKLFWGEHSDHFKLVYESPLTSGVVPSKIWEIQYEESTNNGK